MKDLISKILKKYEIATCSFLFQGNPFENTHWKCLIEKLLMRTTTNTVKPVLSGHSKIDKTKILKTNGSLMKV